MKPQPIDLVLPKDQGLVARVAAALKAGGQSFEDEREIRQVAPAAARELGITFALTRSQRWAVIYRYVAERM